jgi:acyl-[acyl-carrier-protein]-phospholipid O-acyltransferase/long-chain-fatty-acid--[acyl-carrier-protein] ligase
LFHTFGLVAAALMPLITGTRLFLYVSPLRYRAIPELVYTSQATYLFGTTTFLSHYARQAHAGDFQSVRKVICGGEKLTRQVSDLGFEKFGLRVLEGYGATECGPAMALNTPLAYQRGSVGRFLPGIEHRIVPVPGIAAGGALFVRGPNLMSGYLLHENPGVLAPPHSAQGAGWHDTGDIVEMDSEGFVTIVGRTRRYVKIAGEMVSLDMIEHIASLASPQHRHAANLDQSAGHGESTVLFTTDASLDRLILLRAVREFGASELLIARRIVVVSELPVLGAGKTDYVALSARG